MTHRYTKRWAFSTAFAFALGVNAQCNGDNCARAVTGTGLGAVRVASAKADCSSFLVTTVLADAVTITVTEAPPFSTDVPSRVIPTYASPCSGSSRYSSACSCWGISGQQVTVTPTSTVTASTAPTPSIPPPVFQPEIPDSYSWCAFDPRVEISFQLGDPISGLPIINNATVAKVVQSVPENYTPPRYKTSKPEGVAAGLYDLVLEGEQPLYLAVYQSGKVGFVTESSHGQVYVSNGTDSYITTAFIISCQGRITAGILGGDEFFFLVSDDKALVASVGASKSRRDANSPRESIPGFLIIPTNRPSPPNNDRCFWNQKTVSKGIPPTTNGCGPEGGFQGIDLVPDFNFGTCCDAHDRCFGTCSETFSSCNNAFFSCAMAQCAKDFHAYPLSYLGCVNTAVFYDAAILMGGGKAFQAATKKHCDCQCSSERYTSCDDKCVDLQNDYMNCGQCYFYCPGGQWCVKGECRFVLPGTGRSLPTAVPRR